MTARLPRVDIVRNDDRQWFWRFVASNGRELARSSETYKRRSDCWRCVQLVLGEQRSGAGEGMGDVTVRVLR